MAVTGTREAVSVHPVGGKVVSGTLSSGSPQYMSSRITRGWYPAYSGISTQAPAN